MHGTSCQFARHFVGSPDRAEAVNTFTRGRRIRRRTARLLVGRRRPVRSKLSFALESRRAVPARTWWLKGNFRSWNPGKKLRSCHQKQKRKVADEESSAHLFDTTRLEKKSQSERALILLDPHAGRHVRGNRIENRSGGREQETKLQCGAS